MFNNDITRTIQKKNGRNWETTYTSDDAANNYEALSNDLIDKKINQAGYIKSIKREQLYTHVRITTTYDNGYRAVYEIAEH